MATERPYDVEVQVFVTVLAEDAEDALRVAEYMFPSHMRADAVAVYDPETGEEL